MAIRQFRVVPVVALMCAVMALLTPGAMGQGADSAAALRRENDQLRERVAQLEARVKQLEKEADAYKLEIDRLRAAAKPGGAPAAPGAPGRVPTTGDVIPPDAQEPLACPDALLVALQNSYTKAFVDKTFDENTKPQYIQEVRKWARDAEREFKGNVTWVIRVDKENLPSSVDDPIPFWVIDPETGKLLHPKTVKATLPGRVSSRILENSDVAVWDVKGQFQAKPDVNADRADRGLLDFPAFVGPFAEFGYELNLRTAQPHEQKQP